LIKEHILGVFHGCEAKIVYHDALGSPTNSFLLMLPEAMNSISSRHGFRKVKALINCYIPDAICEYMHDHSVMWEQTYRKVLKELLEEYRLDFNDIAFLSTGVSMENLAFSEQVYEDLWVVVFTTAGVKNNALRIGVDSASGIERNGKFKRIGTINNILLTGTKLDNAALVGAVINMTEAKNVALQDLDIRCSSNKDLLATGTGTDQLMVVPGKGERCTYVGGHTKIGEMIARATTSSTVLAIERSKAQWQKSHPFEK